jgi:hypothetical protein
MDDRSRAPPQRPRTPHQRRQDKIKRDAHRERAREASRAAKTGERKKVDGKPDTLRAYPLWLLDSEVRDLTRMADEADDSDNDPILIGYAWRKWIGQQAAKIFRDRFQAVRPKRR